MEQQRGGADATQPPAAAGEEQFSSPSCYLITYNVAKKHNMGTLARCATAFNVREVCLVGSRQFNAFGSHGATDFVAFRHYNTLEECCQDLRANKGCTVVGVEIMDSAHPVHRFPFCGNTAFMLGNEGQGLNERQVALCDSFVYIPQYGGGTASLNVAVAASIVLQHFAVYARYGERPREGQKFTLDERPQRIAARGFVPLTEQELAAERQRRRAGAAAEAEAPPDLFD